MSSHFQEHHIADIINLLTADAYTRAVGNGFWQHFPGRFADERVWIGEKIALAHTELSEALDHSRNLYDPADRYEQILGELGDCIWRCLDMAYVIHQFDDLPPEVCLGGIMMHQAKHMPMRGKLHGKRW